MQQSKTLTVRVGDEQSDVSSDIDGSHLDVEVNQLMFDIFGDSEGEDSIA